jgi:hypothetical protein
MNAALGPFEKVVPELTYRSEAAPRSRIALVWSGSVLSGSRLNSGSDWRLDDKYAEASRLGLVPEALEQLD